MVIWSRYLNPLLKWISKQTKNKYTAGFSYTEPILAIMPRVMFARNKEPFYKIRYFLLCFFGCCFFFVVVAFFCFVLFFLCDCSTLKVFFALSLLIFVLLFFFDKTTTTLSVYRICQMQISFLRYKM